MGSFLGRDALTGIAIERGQRVVTIPIEYVGVEEHKRKTSLDQGWRIAGLPVAGNYNDYGASTTVEAPQIAREDSGYTDRGHMFMVRSRLFHHLVEEGAKWVRQWDGLGAENLEAFRGANFM